jgi:hypothetical protein
MGWLNEGWRNRHTRDVSVLVMETRLDFTKLGNWDWNEGRARSGICAMTNLSLASRPTKALQQPQHRERPRGAHVRRVWPKRRSTLYPPCLSNYSAAHHGSFHQE